MMAGTLYRIISDDYKTIALYRSVGASTKDILQIFGGYTLVLCLLIIACSAIIGFVLSFIISATHSAHVTAIIAEMYNIPEAQGLWLIGFDYRIFLIFLAIILVGIICFSFIINKLVSGNIVKTLRQ